jgi:hypothetical protein
LLGTLTNHHVLLTPSNSQHNYYTPAGGFVNQNFDKKWGLPERASVATLTPSYGTFSSYLLDLER